MCARAALPCHAPGYRTEHRAWPVVFCRLDGRARIGVLAWLVLSLSLFHEASGHTPPQW